MIQTKNEAPQKVARSERSIKEERAVKNALRAALIRHKLLGQSIAGVRDGKQASIPAEEIVIPPKAE